MAGARSSPKPISAFGASAHVPIVSNLNLFRVHRPLHDLIKQLRGNRHPGDFSRPQWRLNSAIRLIACSIYYSDTKRFFSDLPRNTGAEAANQDPETEKPCLGGNSAENDRRASGY